MEMLQEQTHLLQELRGFEAAAVHQSAAGHDHGHSLGSVPPAFSRGRSWRSAATATAGTTVGGGAAATAGRQTSVRMVAGAHGDDRPLEDGVRKRHAKFGVREEADGELVKMACALEALLETRNGSF